MASSAEHEGYDFRFIPPLDDDLVCSICLLALRKPVQTPCGHRFCKHCLDRYHLSSSRTICPLDKKKLGLQAYFADAATERKILSSNILCPNEGCLWQGELRAVRSHRNECEYELVTCLLDNCVERIIRRNLRRHMDSLCAWRKVRCTYCDKMMPLYTKTKHQETCPNYPAKCPNGCRQGKVFLVNEQVEKHLQHDCPLTKLPCQFEGMGCSEMVQRSLMPKHLQTAVQQHLLLACNKVTELEEMVYCGTPFIWRITDFQRHVDEAKTNPDNEVIESKPFFTERYGYKMKVRMFLNGGRSRGGYGDQILIHVIVMKSKYDSILPWPITTHRNISVTVIDQQQNMRDRRNLPLGGVTPLSLSINQGNIIFFAGRVRHDSLWERKYIVDDSLFLEVNVTKK